MDKKLTGKVVLPGNQDYNAARTNYNKRFSKFPLAIVFCQQIQDVINAIKWARRHEVPFRVRSGRHNYEAFSLVNGGIIIDVSGLNSVCVDLAKGEALVGTGIRLLPLYRALWKDGVTIPCGDCPSVGIGGITLGGGFGMLTRLMGMTCDNLLALTMVNADGQIIHANEEINSDLLWACRGGGGGNFGVLTSYTFKVHPIFKVGYFKITWDWDAAIEVMEAWQNWAPFVDNRLTSVLRVYNRQANQVVADGQFVGPEKELRHLIQPLLTAAQPIKIDVVTVPFIQAALINADLLTPDGKPQKRQEWGNFKNTGAYVYSKLPTEALCTIIKFLQASPSRRNYLEFQALAGVVKEVPPDATAYFHRQALFVLQYLALWDDDSEADENIRWVESFRRKMLDDVVGDYVNFPDICIKNWQEAYYGTNLARLRQVKSKYDPQNIFHFPQSIPLPGKQGGSCDVVISIQV